MRKKAGTRELKGETRGDSIMAPVRTCVAFLFLQRAFRGTMNESPKRVKR